MWYIACGSCLKSLLHPNKNIASVWPKETHNLFKLWHEHVNIPHVLYLRRLTVYIFLLFVAGNRQQYMKPQFGLNSLLKVTCSSRCPLSWCFYLVARQHIARCWVPTNDTVMFEYYFAWLTLPRCHIPNSYHIQYMPWSLFRNLQYTTHGWYMIYISCKSFQFITNNMNL